MLQCKGHRRLPFLHDAVHEKYLASAGIRGCTAETEGRPTPISHTGGAGMSIAIYRRIGFQEYCNLLHYT